MERDYLYDASTLPTFLGPLARWYYFHTTKLTPEEKKQRKILFGGFAEGQRPLKPYLWEVGESRLLEIPVTTMPILRLPFHFSYLHYIATYSPTLSLLYFHTALALCRAMRVEPSLLLHPLDFLGGDDVRELAFFPAMKLSGHLKLQTLHLLLDNLGRRYAVVPLGQLADRARGSSPMRISSPS